MMMEGHESKGHNVKKYLFVLCALSVSPVWAASFPCEKATTPTERTICSDPGLNKLDETMASNYRSVMAATKEAGFGGESDLKKEQSVWINSTNKCGSDVSCLNTVYIERINGLCEQAIAPGVFPQNCVTVPTGTDAKSDAELGLTPYDPANDPDNAPAPQPQQSTQLPMEVKTKGNSIVVISTVDNLVVDRIEVNRGNCTTIDLKAARDKEAYWKVKQPNVAAQIHYNDQHAAQMGILKYGQYGGFDTSSSCVIREANIYTSLGSWTITFQ